MQLNLLPIETDNQRVRLYHTFSNTLIRLHLQLGYTNMEFRELKIMRLLCKASEYLCQNMLVV